MSRRNCENSLIPTIIFGSKGYKYTVEYLHPSENPAVNHGLYLHSVRIYTSPDVYLIAYVFSTFQREVLRETVLFPQKLVNYTRDTNLIRIVKYCNGFFNQMESMTNKEVEMISNYKLDKRVKRPARISHSLHMWLSEFKE